jgi:hypothetical protein
VDENVVERTEHRHRPAQWHVEMALLLGSKMNIFVDQADCDETVRIFASSGVHDPPVRIVQAWQVAHQDTYHSTGAAGTHNHFSRMRGLLNR